MCCVSKKCKHYFIPFFKPFNFSILHFTNETKRTFTVHLKVNNLCVHILHIFMYACLPGYIVGLQNNENLHHLNILNAAFIRIL